MLTPLEIENKKFSKQMVNGYNLDEVDEFLDELTVDYEKLYKENTDLKNKLNDLNSSVSQYKALEDTLKNTLVMAQSTAEEVKIVAQQKASQIINEAQNSASEAARELEQRVIIKRRELEEVKKQFDIYRAKMESLLISQLELIKDIKEQD